MASGYPSGRSALPFSLLATALATVLVPALIASCGGGGSSGSSGTTFSISVDAVVQDLALDPDGRVTTVDFSSGPGALSPGNFVTDGPAVPVSVVLAAGVATVTWDDRVTPTHRVRIVGKPAVESTFQSVTTSDATAPTFAITDGTQVAGIGGDTLTAQFAGPRLVEAQAEDPASWALRVDGVELDLAGSTFELDPTTQVLTVTLADADLFAAFELSATGVQSVADTPVDATFVGGAATGDSDAPSVVSAVQVLAEDEFGRVVDFTFDEPMSPVFATQLSNFDAGFPTFASAVEQTADDVLRVWFTAPVIADVDSVTLAAGLVDAHGNAIDNGGATLVTAGSTVANGFDGSPTLLTTANFGGDVLTATFVQAFDPAHGADPLRWMLDVGGSGVDLSQQTLTYDLATKTLVIELVDDFANGAAFDLAPVVAGPPVDVDGQPFTATFSGTVDGDVGLPTVLSVVQNRTADPTGASIDVHFSEDVDVAQAETVGNYAVTGLVVQVATRLSAGEVVRLNLDGPALPGDVTVDVQNVVDLAGNAMDPAAGLSVSSTDTVAPSASGVVASAVEGADNDTIVATFSDAMVVAEVEDPANWTFESPIGVARDTSSATVTWVGGTRIATLVFDGGGVDLQTRDDFSLTFTGMRDLGGNTVVGTAIAGTIDAEETFPEVVSAWVETGALNHVHVRFSEPCQHLDDVFDATTNPTGLTVYELYDGSGLLKGDLAAVAVDADAMGVELTFTAGAVAGVDMLDVRGVADLAGNQMFPAYGFPIDGEDPLEPGLDTGMSAATTVSGEHNDVVTVLFDRPVSPWLATDPSVYTLEQGGVPIAIASAGYSFDGDREVTIRLDASGAQPLTNGLSYDLFVDGLLSAQGVAMSGASTDAAVAAGDATAPDLPLSRCRLDAQDPASSILIEMSEAIAPLDFVDPSNYAILGVNPDTVERLGFRTARATWNGGVNVSDVVDVTLEDLAGNASGLVSRAAQAAETSGPVVLSVLGVATPGIGGDLVVVTFDHPVDPSSGTLLENYVVSQGGVALDISGASVRFDSGPATVTLGLAPGVELDASLGIHVFVDGVQSHAGLTIDPPASVNGSVTGDMTAPGLVAGLVDLRTDAAGTTVDLRFDEHVDPTAVGDPLSWDVDGGLLVTSATLIHADVVRVVLSGPLGPGDEIRVTGATDLAGNAAGQIGFTPLP